MTIERYLRLIAGSILMITLILAVTVSEWWLIGTAVVAVNLFQSAFTNWCPMVWLLERRGVEPCVPAGHPLAAQRMVNPD
ncbi:MAG TPA: DUF2892 domain-containing protein [Armatimonadota bacterium]|nr:DUF2892 domain-containing protein [Armatimonadota bacterium]